MDLDTRRHKAIVIQSYAARAATYAGTAHPGEKVGPMIDLAMPKKTDRMLDVATGAGLVAVSFAPLVASVQGIDITPEMVAQARGQAHERKLENATFETADIEALPFTQGSYDLVTCRSAFHYLVHPDKALHEMARVLDSKGRIVLYELTASDDPKKSARHNEIMSMRDPSHTRILSSEEWATVIRRCGLHVAAKVVVLMKRDFDDWMALIRADAKRSAVVRKALLDTVEGDKAALGARARGDKLTFSQTCGIWLLTK